MCLAQGHNTVTLVGFEPRTSRFGVRSSTTTPPRSLYLDTMSRKLLYLNRPSSINKDDMDILPQIEYNVLLDESPAVMETRKAVQQLSSGKTPGADAIPAQPQRHLSPTHCWDDTGKNSVESPECSSWSKGIYPRKSMWMQKTHRDNTHDLHSKTAS